MSRPTLADAMQRLSVEGIYPSLDLSKGQTNSNYRSRCPRCPPEKRGRSLSIKSDGSVFRCFRCGWSGNAPAYVAEVEGCSLQEAHIRILERAGFEVKRKVLSRRKPTRPSSVSSKSGEALAYRPVQDRSPEIAPALGSITRASSRYLRRRIPGIEIREALEDGNLGRTKKARFRGAHHRDRSGYELFVPIRAVEDDNTIVSGVSRLSRDRTSEEKERGSPKSKTIAGSITGKAACFGHFNAALEAALGDSCLYSRIMRDHLGAPVLVITEGEIDFLCMRYGIGATNCIGARGVGDLPRLAKHLADIKFEGALLLASDNDEAGRKSVTAVKEALEQHCKKPRFQLYESCSCFPEDADITDAYVDLGAAATFEALLAAKPVQLDLSAAVKRSNEQCKERALAPIKGVEAILNDRHKDFLERFVEENPYDSRKPGLKRLGRVGRCCRCHDQKAFIKRGSLSRRYEKRTWQCETVVCSSCRALLVEKNSENLLSRWGEVHYFTVELAPEDHAGARKLRSKVSSATKQIRKEAGADNYGLFRILNPGHLAVFVSGPDELVEKVEGILGAPSIALEGEELYDAVGLELSRYSSYLRGKIEAGNELSDDPWIFKETDQIGNAGSKLPFVTSLREEPEERDEEKEIDKDEIMLNVFSDDQGVLSITERELTGPNKDRAYYGLKERLWNDCNLVRAYLDPKARLHMDRPLESIIEGILDDLGGASPRLSRLPDYWDSLDGFERAGAVEVIHSLNLEFDRYRSIEQTAAA